LRAWIGRHPENLLVITRTREDALFDGRSRHHAVLILHSSVERHVVLAAHDGGAGQLGAAAEIVVPFAGEISLSLPPEAQSCAMARRAVRAFCRTNRLGHLADDAELLTSELVGNALEHSHATVGLTAQCTDASVTVRISDDDAAVILPPPRAPSALAERGRGLFVVSEVAGDWGTNRHGDAKSVWFRLP
jgi:anti-sigma regulatory factor (Ser/Thr protein kinase)